LAATPIRWCGSTTAIRVRSRSIGRERPDLVARYLSVPIRAANWAKDHASEVTAFVAREVNRLPDDVHAGYGPDLHRSFRIDLSPRRLVGLARQS
jgi:ABC-type nitrate/sulfonate/bicarbonate transport system substrate-binding protein